MKISVVMASLILQTCCAAMTARCADESPAFLSVEELLAACGLPRPCQALMPCEGQTVRVKGHIDYDNVFDKEHYPQLPYEKFTIRDSHGTSVEVWVGPGHSREVFRKIHQQKPFAAAMAYVEGQIVGVDMPIMGKCQRGIRIDLTDAAKLFFR